MPLLKVTDPFQGFRCQRNVFLGFTMKHNHNFVKACHAFNVAEDNSVYFARLRFDFSLLLFSLPSSHFMSTGYEFRLAFLIGDQAFFPSPE
ncbi:hypothetical protein A8E62_26380 [Burkholderia cenocepacia]|uniref:Uncharacterized protein n=1 Tax=Burkholderia cenocepacia TaxID=95486 RepID=A0A1V2VWG2_9BURK|nr:hypothetical protein A8E66_04360 [Burkholderia cenocepacia]ONU49812.1 hypothetical protein A8E67_38060 [Burkholderia cenocepacia]ONU51755.1 hypothetical protein A8E62_26380 [Burkholderia cenocepacia]ONU53481.1 hypothetical protein A8E68_37270 [Burkholderia cenocepacia]ONU71918.1 hypothetical protein A8E63_40050 [Burkholderia cenocepacia]